MLPHAFTLLLRALACLLVPGLAAAGWLAGADLGFGFEPGVEHRLVLEAMAARPVSSVLTFSGFIAAALPGLDNPGLARYGLAVETRRARFGLELGLAHEEWSSWTAGENRALLLLSARPARSWTCAVGAAWRVPVFGRTYHSPFVWRADAAELNLAYRLSWRFLSTGRLSAAAYLANTDRSSFRNPQQLPLGLVVNYEASRWTVCARLGTGIKGLSSALFSPAELDAHLGVERGF